MTKQDRPTNEKASPRAAARAAVDDTAALARRFSREDLAARLDQTAQRLGEPGVRVLVVGEFKQGKSTLVNELLGRDLCPVDDDVATAVPTVVRHADEPWGRTYRRGDDGLALLDEEIDPAAAPEYVTELGNPANQKGLVSVEFGVPAGLLRQGLVLVDTPGVGGLDSAHAAITLAALADADAVIFITDASQELTAPEMAFLAQAHELCPTVIHVLSKVDLYPEWRRIQELCAGHLERANLPGTVLGVSSSVHRLARETRDRSLLIESGYLALMEVLQEEVIGPGERIVAKAAYHDVHSCLDQLAAPLSAERAILADPEAASRLLAELEAARDRAAQLQGQAARWQVTLNDGITDLNANVEHDLRSRTRQLQQHAEGVIDAGDPAEFWPELEADLYARMTNHVVQNYALMTHRVNDLVARLDQHFDTESRGVTAPGAVATLPESTIADIAIDPNLELRKASGVAQGFTAFRGGYSGPLMVSMAGTFLTPLAIVAAPLGIVAGVFMGRKALRDERERQLAARRQQAKVALRKYIDEVSFSLGKDSRDALRETQRQLRDTYTARADELARSTRDAVTAAQSTLQRDEAERRSRLQELDRSLADIARLQKAVPRTPRAVSARTAP